MTRHHPHARFSRLRGAAALLMAAALSGRFFDLLPGAKKQGSEETARVALGDANDSSAGSGSTRTVGAGRVELARRRGRS
ncbi:MAG TPA: hypothetical protein VF006_29335 [Longimicrobium sp.]